MCGMKQHLLAALIANSVLVIVSFILAYVFFGDLKHLLIIHFDSYQGIDFWGTKWDIFGMLAAAVAVAAINFFLSKIFYHREKFLSYLFAFFTIFFLILILISLAVIISIN